MFLTIKIELTVYKIMYKIPTYFHCKAIFKELTTVFEAM
jgi:hypothetical protein